MTDDAAGFGDLERIFQEVRGLDAAARGARLDEACAGRSDLRRRIEELLARHDAAGDPLLAVAPVTLETPAATPERIGRYRILQRLGEGGMAVVFLAEQEGTDRRVALKVIRSPLPTVELTQRFGREAQLLGRLRHPGIAQVYEAGVTDDPVGPVAFIAMELVDGLPLVEFADHHDLAVDERLQLMTRVCDAVQHAHDRGVLHRDLKPANILVETSVTGGPGQPKVLDFGIARATDRDVQRATLQTSPDQLLGTVRYMSPEQAAGDLDRVDVRSDVYALGVILYELLAGRSPHPLDGRMVHDALGVIRERDPAPLSSIDRRLRGDLTTIAGTALERDPDRRYRSAGELGDEIRRYLGDEPIRAHPPSTVYQAAKFARRHRVLVVAGAVVVTILLAATIVSTLFALSEAEQRHRAEARFDDVRHLAHVFLFEFDEAIKHVAGTLPARRLVVEHGLAYLDGLAKEAGPNVDLRAELAAGYVRVGDVQGEPHEPSLGDTPGALASYSKAIALLERPDPRSIASRTLFQAMTKSADALVRLNRHDEASALFDAALALAETRADAAPGDVRARADLSLALERQAELLRRSGRDDAVGPLLERSHAIIARIAEGAPQETGYQRDLAVSHFTRGQRAAAAGDSEAAIGEYRTFLDIIGALSAAEPNHVVYRTDLANGLERLGNAHAALGRPDEAMAAYRRMLDIAETLAREDTENVGAYATLAVAHCRVGDLDLAGGAHASAAAHFRGYLDAAAHRAKRDDANAEALRDLAVARYKMGEVLSATASTSKQWRDAGRWFRECIATFTIMRDRGLLWSSDAGVFEAVQADVDRCEAAATAAPVNPNRE